MSRETGAWMPMYWSDYFGDTLHLTAEEHGAYLMLIGVYWLRGAALPDDEQFLRRCAKLSQHKWKKTGESLRPFFLINNGLWTHERLEKEILKSSTRLRSARAAGKAGGLAKSYLPTTTTTVKKETTADAVAKKPPLVPPEGDNHEKLAIPEFLKAGNNAKPRKRKRTVPKDWRPAAEGDTYAMQRAVPDTEVEQFVNYHIAKGTLFADIGAGWRTWCNNHVKYKAERVRDRSQPGGVVAGTLADLAALDGEL